LTIAAASIPLKEMAKGQCSENSLLTKKRKEELGDERMPSHGWETDARKEMKKNTSYAGDNLSEYDKSREAA